VSMRCLQSPEALTSHPGIVLDVGSMISLAWPLTSQRDGATRGVRKHQRDRAGRGGRTLACGR
jgi:hypothetical protein